MVAKVLEHPTLVLNRNWQPVNVATVARALVLLWNESARVVDPADYQLYTWADWSQLRLDEWRAVHPGRAVAAARAGGDRARPIRPAADRRRELQPPQRIQAGPLDLPVLRLCSRAATTDDRPRDAAVARWHFDLGELRAGVHACNKRKADRTPQQAGMRLRKEPVRPTWKPMYARDTRADRKLVEVCQRDVLECEVGRVNDARRSAESLCREFGVHLNDKKNSLQLFPSWRET